MLDICDKLIKKMTVFRLIWIIFFLSMGLIILYAHNRSTLKYEHINYDSQSSDYNLQKITSLESTRGTTEKVKIAFKLKVAEISNYNNIFQTGKMPHGMRMELGYPTKKGLYLILAEGKTPFCIIDSVELNRWYDIIINKNGSMLEVFVNKERILSTPEISSINISDIAVGTGYDRARNFAGEIKDFSIEYQPISELTKTKILLQACTIICILLLTVSLIILIVKLLTPVISKVSTQMKAGYYGNFNPINTRNLLPKIGIVSVILVILTFFQHAGNQTITSPIIKYDSQSSDPKLSSPQYFRGPSKTTTAIDIKFKVNIAAISNYNNIFQTDKMPDGMRLELGYPNSEGLYLILSDREAVSYNILDQIELNQWYDVSIDKKMDTLKVSVSKKKNDNYSTIQSLSIEDPTPIGVEDIAVGTGYNKTRNFAGEIKDFTVKYTYSLKTLRMLYLINLCKTLNILLLSTLLIALAIKTFRTLYMENKGKLLATLSLIISILMVTLPLVDCSANYFVDWHNHVWTIGYFGKFFHSNLTFPLTLNLSDYILYPQPIFYGVLFYPLLGIISSVTGPALAIRLIILVLFFFQYYLCNKLIFIISKDKLISNIVSILVTWSIYPLTNLYNRGALTEFVATIFAFIALCIFLILILDTENMPGKVKGRYLMYLFISMILCLGMHPITAMFFVLTLLFVSIIFFPFVLDFFRRNKTYSAILLLLSLAFVFPVAYPVLLNHDLRIMAGQGVCWFNDGIDSFLHRFSPLLTAIDKRISNQGLADVSTPYLDTQINMSLLFFGLLLLKFAHLSKEQKYTKYLTLSVAFSLIYFFAANLLSLSSSVYGHLPKIFSNIQFCYRMVTYQNFAIFIMVVLLLIFFKIKDYNKQTFTIGLTIIMMFSLSSILIKTEHIYAIKNSQVETGIENYKAFPTTYYSQNDYISKSIEQLTIPVESETSFSLSEKSFGEINPTTINMGKAGWVKSNIARFKWNKIYVDGKLLEPKYIKACDRFLAFYIDAGNHTLKAVCTPPKIYTNTRNLSFFVLFILIFIALIDMLTGMLKTLLGFRESWTRK